MTVFLNNKKKILYIHVPKTGGEYISEQLSNLGIMTFHSKKGEMNNKVVSQHLAGMDLKHTLTKSGINNCDIVVMSVRNPYDRLISHYHYRFKKIFSIKELNINALHKFSSFKTFNNYVCESLEECKNNKNYYNNHFLPQYEFEIFNPKIFKFENGLINLLNYVKNELKSDINFDTSNKSSKPFLAKMLKIKWNRKTLEMVNNYYEEDFKKYNYEMKK